MAADILNFVNFSKSSFLFFSKNVSLTFVAMPEKIFAANFDVYNTRDENSEWGFGLILQNRKEGVR